MEGKRRNNALTQAQAAKLYHWLSENRSSVEARTHATVALAAQNVLGFVVTESNVGSAKKALGIVKPAPVKPAGECRCRELAAAALEWVTSNGCGEAEYQRYVSRLRAVASGKYHTPPNVLNAIAANPPYSAAPELPLLCRCAPVSGDPGDGAVRNAECPVHGRAA